MENIWQSDKPEIISCLTQANENDEQKTNMQHKLVNIFGGLKCVSECGKN